MEKMKKNMKITIIDWLDSLVPVVLVLVGVRLVLVGLVRVGWPGSGWFWLGPGSGWSTWFLLASLVVWL